MLEYFSEAVVLDKEPFGEMDVKVSLFTKKFGKIVARAKSARKITSKLSAHLEPGGLVKVRLVEKNGFQAVDALKIAKINISLFNLFLLNKVLAEMEPDFSIWQILVSNDFNWRKILKILGWDPKEAVCSKCGKSRTAAFNFLNQEFFCQMCASQFSSDELISI